MSVHTIVTRGYASTDNYKIPTLGYGSGAAAVVNADRCEYTIPGQRMEYTIQAQRMEYTVTR